MILTVVFKNLIKYICLNQSFPIFLKAIKTDMAPSNEIAFASQEYQVFQIMTSCPLSGPFTAHIPRPILRW